MHAVIGILGHVLDPRGRPPHSVSDMIGPVGTCQSATPNLGAQRVSPRCSALTGPAAPCGARAAPACRSHDGIPEASIRAPADVHGYALCSRSRLRMIRRAAPGIATAVVATGIWFTPSPDGLTIEAWRLFAIFAAAIFSVVAGALPILTASCGRRRRPQRRRLTGESTRVFRTGRSC